MATQSPQRYPTTAELNGVKSASACNILAGLWLIVAPFVLQFAESETALWNNIVVGLAVLGMAAVRVARPARYAGISWANVLLGVWLIVSPWVGGYAEATTAVWNNVLMGIVIAVLAASSAVMTPSHRAPAGV